MPKDYKNIQPKKKSKPANADQIKSFFSGLTIGLCIAIVVYFYQHGLGQQTEVEQPEVIVEIPEPDSGLPNDTPLPSFDFYEILPNMEVNVSEWEAEEDEGIEEQAEPSNETSEIYILQIGSFRQHDAADEVKAKLALMGIRANVQRVVINGKDIRHRVRVGPYAESDRLSMIRQQLADNKFNYILLKLK